MADPTPDPLDKAIADIIADESNDHHLNEFSRLADQHPDAWRSLAMAFHDELHMRRGLSEALDTSRQAADMEIARAVQQEASSVATARSPHRFGLWAGWSVAAALLLLLLIGLPQRNFHEPSSNTTTSLATYTAEEALDQYMRSGTREGRIITELPTVMVEARPAADGRLEVLYLRQILEREHVSEVFNVSPDELGQPHPVKIDLRNFQDLTL